MDMIAVTPLALSIGSIAFAAYNHYTSTDKGNAVRLSVLETNRVNDVERLERIETKVNAVDTKVDRVLERMAK